MATVFAAAANQPLLPVLEQRSIAGLHVRLCGAGAPLLLLHGTGSTGASWERLMPLLASHFRLIAPDLPGHGASADPGRGRYSPAAMANAVAHLLVDSGLELGPEPLLVVGHSAGAAVLVEGLVRGVITARGFVALNPALLPFPGVQHALFTGSARLLSRLPFVAELIASRGRDPAAVTALLDGIGTELGAAELARYRGLFSEPKHIRTVLTMMAEWDLPAIAAQLPNLQEPTLLLGGMKDRAILPAAVRELAARMPSASATLIPGGGHLLQEELPDCVAARIMDWVQGLPRVSSALL
ncbi:MAG: alpha/beta fold hydrolase BchO [Pseudomonadales bacterium]